jgi:hypothetical protein
MHLLCCSRLESFDASGLSVIEIAARRPICFFISSGVFGELAMHSMDCY